MASTVRRCQTGWLKAEGAEEPEKYPSIPQQQEHPDATAGNIVAHFNLDVDYMGGQNPRMSQMLKKKRRKTLMQNMKNLRCFIMGHCARG